MRYRWTLEPISNLVIQHVKYKYATGKGQVHLRPKSSRRVRLAHFSILEFLKSGSSADAKLGVLQ